MKRFASLSLIALLTAGLGTSINTAEAKGKSKTSKAAKAKTSKAAKAKTLKSDSSAPAAKKVKNYDFLADDIDGSRIRPDDTTIFGLETINHASLIRLRSEFIGEIIKSAEML